MPIRNRQYKAASLIINIQNAELLWKYTTGGAVSSTAALAKGILYIGSADNNLYALNSTDGQLIWKYETDGEVASSPVITNTRVMFGSTDGKIYAGTRFGLHILERYRSDS